MNTCLRIAGIIRESIVDGPGIRMVVFAQGCKHKCPGCHNPETHSFDGGTLVTINSVIELAKKNPLLDGITFSGGEPFEQAEAFAALAREAKKLNLNIMTYTGYTYEYILANASRYRGWGELLDETDILVDGRFELEKRNLLLNFRGSENQRIIDVKRSKAENAVVVIDL
ncbi:anaerobic ribonucleoside-triphosphate reductase activating protein NrdG [Thermoclostridium stercorarium subsp. stercorarium DSM 8532]|uniref:Anaerobic ribonucleoside-triphosphate reductase-activating protein n=2 Tax=Thermoclostridium stercorarium TaxID=1510 RepID=L7VKC1_THES1|nr:anaerobic ribonucleoside-triphosphate reductase activating protein [Thermoclostridium stercorarium]AGC67104.1 anaerobic ribonucleoside-triphosphate reductase activating protein NrdG [Thermoclostridium stercorarium subsp. stercorarium DSM 8532]AGI38185.1 ribonucleoside-triphosphate reductase-activating protein [Thermoclostridium stercorarium subsp. stercorarium DSM 8532]ANW97591.1 anaerobic ribonucleoside-triphosphate reductase activating protein [Thermoclostridium stercorarium subsp. thermola